MIINFAHRGASHYAPENTFAAFYKGLELGAQGIETDIQVTKDKKFVLFHDDTLKRITGDDALVKDYSLDELKQKDFGSWFSHIYKAERILTLQEFLHHFGHRNLHLALELKAIEEDNFDDFISIIEPYNTSSNICITSFILENILLLKKKAKHIKAGYLTEEFTKDTIDFLVENSIEQVCPKASDTNKDMVDYAHAKGLDVRAWGVENEAYMFQALKHNVNGMTINFPDKLSAALMWKK